MDFLRRNFGIFSTLVVLVGLGSLLAYWVYSAQSEIFVPRTDNTLRRWMYSDPDFLNPVIRTDVYASYVLGYAHHALVDWDMIENEVRPKLCTHWEIAENGLDYTFHLRRDVRWHDGEGFDADDVLFSFAMVMNPRLPVGYARSSYMDVKIVESLPEEDGDGHLTAEEYLALTLSELPELGERPELDGRPEAGAAVVAESSVGQLRAAMWEGRLYLSAPLRPRLDTAIFLAEKPGEPTAYGPTAKVAEWDALFLSDSGNTFPAETGWLAIPRERVGSASYALGETALECLVDLDELFPARREAPLERLFVVAALVDDVQLEKLDQYTVRFHFPQRVFSNLEAGAYLRLIPEHVYADSDDLMNHPRRDELVGLGPYKLVHWKRNNSILLERWEDYWGEPKPKIQRVEFKIISDPVVAYQVFRKGDIDALDGVSVWNFTQKAVGPKFEQNFYKLAFTRPGYGYVGWNTRRSFFSDYRCRQAMAHLVDVTGVAEHLLMGLNVPITGPFYFKEPAYDSSLPVYEYNIEKAAALLDEAGWIDSDGDGIRDKDLNGDGIISDEPLDEKGDLREKFSFDFLISGSGADVQNDWRLLSFLRNCPKVGVQCNARNVEWAVFLDWLRAGDYDAQASGWVMGLEADPYGIFHTSQIADGFNRGAYSNPELDRMMEEARQELDKEKRTEMFRQIHRVLHREQPYAFLLGSTERWVLNKRVRNVRVYDLGLDPLEWELGDPAEAEPPQVTSATVREEEE